MHSRLGPMIRSVNLQYLFQRFFVISFYLKYEPKSCEKTCFHFSSMKRSNWIRFNFFSIIKSNMTLKNASEELCTVFVIFCPHFQFNWCFQLYENSWKDLQLEQFPLWIIGRPNRKLRCFYISVIIIIFAKIKIYTIILYFSINGANSSQIIRANDQEMITNKIIIWKLNYTKRENIMSQKRSQQAHIINKSNSFAPFNCMH